jgi:recombination protein RecT
MTDKKQTSTAGKEVKTNPQQTSALEVLQKNVADAVLVKIAIFQQNNAIRLPADYVPENALKSAWLILLETKNANKEPVLEKCTKESIANALLNMVIQGLNPVKKQCDFIAYGDKLLMQREYHGTIALAKRFGGVKGVTANVIYEGDDFKYEINPINGYKRIITHDQSFENIAMDKILGAYATLVLEDGDPYVEIMNMAQIRQAWNQGATKGQSPAHRNFPDEMAKKTVIGRACKLFITSSDDGALFEDQVMDGKDPAAKAADIKIHDHANQEELGIEDEFSPSQVIDDKEAEKKIKREKIQNEPEGAGDEAQEAGRNNENLFEQGNHKPKF